VRFRVLCATKYRDIGFPGPASTSPFPARPRGLPPAAVRRRLAPTVSSSRALPSPPELASPTRPATTPGTSLGVSSLIATSAGGVHVCGRPRPARSVLGVSHALDGFLHHRPRGFISPHCRVQGSLSRGFPRRTAARAFARRCPLAVHACSLPPVAQRRQKPAPAFRAFLRAEIRCQGVRG
jgi:hypothetical protein